MLQFCESIGYETMEQLNDTYTSGHPDILAMQKKYGDNVSFGRVSNAKGIIPKFELRVYKEVNKRK